MKWVQIKQRLFGKPYECEAVKLAVLSKQTEDSKFIKFESHFATFNTFESLKITVAFPFHVVPNCIVIKKLIGYSSVSACNLKKDFISMVQGVDYVLSTSSQIEVPEGFQAIDIYFINGDSDWFQIEYPDNVLTLKE